LVVSDLQGIVLEANEAAAGLLGVAPSSLAGKSLAVFGFDARELRQLLGELERAGGPLGPRELTLAPPEGGTFAVTVDARCVDEGGAAGGSAVVWVVNVVLHGTAEEELRIVKQAEREFVTNAAHELLTPLAAITSAIDVLQGGAKDDPVLRDRFLGHAERETKRLARLARALLLLARAQMGLEAPRAAVVAAAPLLEEIARELPVTPAVDVRVRCPDNLAFVGSRELLLQALATIGANAAKFTARGSIEFRARREGASMLVVDVVDTGSGIPVAEQGRIFDRFYQASAGSAEGFGLGLAIARAATEALGGTLALRSRPGEGTTVTLTVPGAELVSS
jgi:signal transduction histidine kinase